MLGGCDDGVGEAEEERGRAGNEEDDERNVEEVNDTRLASC